MAVTLYFGLPGCGKTTMLAKLAYNAIRRGTYAHVYTNVSLNMPGVTVIDNECIGMYELRDCLLLIDEATLFADSRDYKNFSKGRLSYFLEHRHRNADICLFTQQWDGVDRKIRTITDRVYYIKKGLLFGRWFSSCYKIPYDIIIPDPKRAGDKLGEIIQGYCKPPWIVRIFSQRIYRPRFYPFFDSWELDELPALPSKYKSTAYEFSWRRLIWQHNSKAIVLLRSVRRYRRRSGKAYFSRCLVKSFSIRRVMRRERAWGLNAPCLGQ